MTVARVFIGALALLGAGFFGPVSATAQADEGAARAHFEKGTAYYNLARFKDALMAFEAAYLEKADPTFLYNMAQSHRQMGNAAEAVRFYKTYLRNAPEAANRAEVERRIAELEAQAVVTPKPPVANDAPAVAPAGAITALPPVVARPVSPPVGKLSKDIAGPDEPPVKPLVRRWYVWTAAGALVAIGAFLVFSSGPGNAPACPAMYMCAGR